MINIFNRKELVTTLNAEKQANIRDVLSINNIPYTVKITSLCQHVGDRRGRVSGFGINPDYAYEYKIFVHKKDYDKAVALTKK